MQSCHGGGMHRGYTKASYTVFGSLECVVVLYISAKHVLETLGTVLVVRVLVFFLKCAIYCIALAMYLYIDVF